MSGHITWEQAKTQLIARLEADLAVCNADRGRLEGALKFIAMHGGHNSVELEGNRIIWNTGACAAIAESALRNVHDGKDAPEDNADIAQLRQKYVTARHTLEEAAKSVQDIATSLSVLASRLEQP